MATLTISLPDKMKEFVETQVADQGFGTVSEYLRSLIRDEQKRRAQARLAELVLEAMDEDSAPVTDEDWAMIRRQVLARHEARRRA